ncbi:MAG TPA: hypothetical protein VFG76_04480 [Candidatus Polarisedimenticolia bacterium]|nr:hypothetical protein [Candidatus Polarisedimenticolia bacterium]
MKPIVVSLAALMFTSAAFAQCLPEAGPACPAVCVTPPPPVAACAFLSLDLSGGAVTTLTWLAPVGCGVPLVYDVARGDLDCFRGCRTIGATCPTCLPAEDDDVDLMAVDALVPPPGNGYWYLVRVDGGVAPGTWNTDNPFDYNASLLAAAVCPL